RPLQPTAFTIRNYFNNIDFGIIDYNNPSMIASQIISHLHSMHPARPFYKTEDRSLSPKNAYHLEGLDIETFQELPNTRLIRLDIHGALLTASHVNLHWRLERRPQGRSTVGKRFIRLEFRQRLNRAFRTTTNLIHVCLKI